MSLDRQITDGLEQGLFTAAQLLVHDGRRRRVHRAIGSLAEGGEGTTLDSLFDIASLTKGLATALCVARLVSEGELCWDTPACALVTALKRGRHREITVDHLITHTSGLPWWAPLFEGHPGHRAVATSCESPPQLWRAASVTAIESMELESRPGEAFCYSDPGYILLGELVERAATQPFARCFNDWVAAPLGLLGRLTFRPAHPRASGWEGCVATETCPWRGRTLRGEVHDQNAWAMGGSAGHAGLFATTEAVDTVVEHILACHRGEDDWLPTEVVREMMEPPPGPPESWSRGFDRPSPEGSQAGNRLSRDTGRGLLGFTGTSVWFDLEGRQRVVLLTNRVHKGRTQRGFKDFRPALHDTLFTHLEQAVDFGDWEVSA